MGWSSEGAEGAQGEALRLDQWLNEMAHHVNWRLTAAFLARPWDQRKRLVAYTHFIDCIGCRSTLALGIHLLNQGQAKEEEGAASPEFEGQRCAESESIRRYLADLMSDEEKTGMIRHLFKCEECAAELEICRLSLGSRSPNIDGATRRSLS